MNAVMRYIAFKCIMGEWLFITVQEMLSFGFSEMRLVPKNFSKKPVPFLLIFTCILYIMNIRTIFVR